MSSVNFLNRLAAAILSTESDAIVASDKEGIIQFWNPGAERIFGYGKQAAIGQTLDIIIPERLRKRHWDGYRHVIATGQSRYGHGDILAVPGIRADGTGISLEFTIIPVRGDAGELIGLIAVMRDVTRRFEEMRELKRKLSEATKGTS
jgi:PAS domain S-box-containing protein